MNWKIEEAQQKLSELISAAVSEPQLIYNQDKLVAAVVEAELFRISSLGSNSSANPR